MQMQRTKHSVIDRLLILLVIAIMMLQMSDAGPMRHRRGVSNYVFPKFYRYHVMRPDACVDDRLFTDCYICGKIADDSKIYTHCCRREEAVVNFCDQLLS